MSSELKDYLLKDILYWRMQGPNSFPLMTLGGYLLRLHRLEALADRLDPEQQTALRDARREFETQTHAWAVRATLKYRQELDARLKLLAQYLGELEIGSAAVGHWPHEAETRTVIELLLDEARQVTDIGAYEARAGTLDATLERHLVPGGFAGDPEWERAYPAERFWWMWREIRRTP